MGWWKTEESNDMYVEEKRFFFLFSFDKRMKKSA